jgi:hypothetical protein
MKRARFTEEQISGILKAVELPRNPAGRLDKRLLKDRYWGKENSRIV